MAVVPRPDWQARADAKQRRLGLGLLLVAAVVVGGVEARHAGTLGDLEALRRAARVASLDRLDPALEGQAVHAVGTITSARLVDDLGVVVEGLRLERVVRMLRWEQVEETWTDSDGKDHTRWVCERVWSADPGDCCWRHPNPHMPLRSASYVAEGARLGPYRLTRPVAAAAPLRPYLSATPPHMARLKLTQVGAGWRHGDPAAPEVGDLQLEYLAATPPPTPGVAETELSYSVLAAQAGDALVPWVPPRGGSGLALVAPGRVGVERLVGAAVDSTSAPWLWRVAALLVAGLGAQLVLVTLDLDWRRDALSFVAAGCSGAAWLLAVAAVAHGDSTLGGLAGLAAVAGVTVTAAATRRSTFP